MLTKPVLMPTASAPLMARIGTTLPGIRRSVIDLDGNSLVGTGFCDDCNDLSTALDEW